MVVFVSERGNHFGDMDEVSICEKQGGSDATIYPTWGDMTQVLPF